MVEIEEIKNLESEEIQERTSIDILLDIMSSENPAELLSSEKLKKVAEDVKESFNEDLESMSEWIDFVEAGKALMSQEFESRTEPWDGAANYKSPMIIDSVLKFGDTASQELLRKSEVVKGMVIGVDKGGVKAAQASRVASFMNYQVNVQMPEWRVEHDKLLYTLPSTGCMFKKTFYDSSLQRNVSDVIFYPNFVVNQSNTTIEGAKSFTQIMQYTENQVVEKKRTGQWLDVDLIVSDENLEGQAEENEDRFLEQHAWFDLDDDGYKEPYTVTMHEQSMTVVKISPRFMPKDVTVTYKGERFNLAVVMQMWEEMAAEGVEDTIKPDSVAFIKPINLLTKYDFIPDPEGEFLGIGYPRLLCGNATAVNTTTNQLLDAGTLANLKGGYLAKGVRKKLGNETFSPGEWKSTNVPARDFKSAFFPLPYSEPSQTLYALNEKMQREGERTASNADFSKVLANNAPATTTLALLQKETQSTTSIIRRVYLAMSEEFKKMALLNEIFVDEKTYMNILDDESANVRLDFDASLLNLVPTANPEMSTRIERVKSAEVQMNFLPQIAEAGGQTQVVIRNFLDALGVENIDQIFPEPQPQQIEIQNQQLEQQNAAQEFQNSLFDRELAVREADISRKIAETESKIAETKANLVEIKSRALLNLEKAETEEQKNKIAVYTAELEGLIGLMGKLKGENDANDKPTS